MKKTITIIFIGMIGLSSMPLSPAGEITYFRKKEPNELEGLAPYRQFDKWGYRGEDGHFVIPPRYEQVGKFSEGLAPIQLNEKWGYIDRTGRLVIPFQFDKACPFFNGMAVVTIDGEKKIIDPKGNHLASRVQKKSIGGFNADLYCKTADKAKIKEKAAERHREKSLPKTAQEKFLGEWVNTDIAGGLTKLKIYRKGDDWFAHGWGKCHPRDCDWGEMPLYLVGESVRDKTFEYGFITRDSGFKDSYMTFWLDQDYLYAEIISIYKDDTDRSHRRSLSKLRRVETPEEGDEDE